MLNTIVSYSAAGYMLRERGGGERGGEREIGRGMGSFFFCWCLRWGLSWVRSREVREGVGYYSLF